MKQSTAWLHSRLAADLPAPAKQAGRVALSSVYSTGGLESKSARNMQLETAVASSPWKQLSLIHLPIPWHVPASLPCPVLLQLALQPLCNALEAGPAGGVLCPACMHQLKVRSQASKLGCVHSRQLAAQRHGGPLSLANDPNQLAGAWAAGAVG